MPAHVRTTHVTTTVPIGEQPHQPLERCPELPQLHQLYSDPLSLIAWSAAERGWDCRRDTRGSLLIRPSEGAAIHAAADSIGAPQDPSGPGSSTTAAVLRVELIPRLELSYEAVIAAASATEELRFGTVTIAPARSRPDDGERDCGEAVSLELVHRAATDALDTGALPEVMSSLAASGSHLRGLLASQLGAEAADERPDPAFSVTLTLDEETLCDPKIETELPRPPRRRPAHAERGHEGLMDPIVPESERLLPQGLQQLLASSAIAASESTDMDGINPIALARVCAEKEPRLFNEVFGPDANEYVMQALDTDLLTNGYARTLDMLRKVGDRYDAGLIYVGVVNQALEATFPSLAATIGLLRWQAGQRAKPAAAPGRAQETKRKESRRPQASAGNGAPAQKSAPVPTRTELSKALRKRVQGQDHVVDAITSRLIMARRGLADRSKNRPEGVFLFAGPTGVGKTELATALADELFGKQDGGAETLIRLDMSEYHRDWAVSRLIGPNPGYHGSNDPSGWLTTRIANSPACVLLLDEFEKAHHEVWQLFLQVFEDGRLTDGRGNSVDFSRTVIVMTSNLGAGAFTPTEMGFTSGGQPESVALAAEHEASVVRAVRKALPPELFNRIDGTHVFNPLSRDRLSGIARSKLSATKKELKRSGFDLRLDARVAGFIAGVDYDPSLGARPLGRSIDRLIREPLIDLEAGRYDVSVEGEALTFERITPDGPAQRAAKSAKTTGVTRLPRRRSI